VVKKQEQFLRELVEWAHNSFFGLLGNAPSMTWQKSHWLVEILSHALFEP